MGMKHEPQQTVVEPDGVGQVLAGSVRSIRLLLVDALADPDVSEVFVVTASGEPVSLRVRDEAGRPVAWDVREASW